MKTLQFLQEDNGIFSSNRLALLLWVLGTLLIWGVSSLEGETLKEVPDTVLILIGMLMSGKVIQKFGEKPATTPVE